VILGDFEYRFRGALSGRRIAAKYFDERPENIKVGVGRYMCQCDRTRVRLLHQFPCQPYVTEQPSRVGEIDRRADTGIEPEAKFDVAVPLRIVHFERFLQMSPRSDEIALNEARYAQDAAGDRRLRDSLLDSRFALEQFSGLPRMRKFAPAKAYEPQPVIGRESLGRIAHADPKFLRAAEGSLRLLRSEASGP
jgi:hypothetical protein